MINLFSYQHEALQRMHNGCILCGAVGSGKSITGLAYYFTLNGGSVEDDNWKKMDHNPMDLYVITTAKKRDSREWQNKDMVPFELIDIPEKQVYNHKVVVDSWNNIRKYVEVKDAFFIFDEQRVVGSGAWVKAFYKITEKNQWILLSGTPGDTWSDYIPVFVANGYFKNKTEFARDHIVFDRFSKYPKIRYYLGENKLRYLREKTLVNMNFERKTVAHNQTIWVDYDQIAYKKIMSDRWNIEKNEPFQNANEVCMALRKCVNSDPSRIKTVKEIVKDRRTAIIFYNYDYELYILKRMCEELKIEDMFFGYSEWNGHKHENIPNTEDWVYLVQYNAGCEGWNCIETNTMIFFSQNYSYRIMVQASGRINRLNTPFKDLFYYNIKTRSSIDLSIARALSTKKKFNENRFLEHYG